jgi:hypothetical protein
MCLLHHDIQLGIRILTAVHIVAAAQDAARGDNLDTRRASSDLLAHREAALLDSISDDKVRHTREWQVTTRSSAGSRIDPVCRQSARIAAPTGDTNGGTGAENVRSHQPSHVDGRRQLERKGAHVTN